MEELTDEELRVRVAELCGIEGPYHRNMNNIRIGGTNKGRFVCDLPDYPNDLNAMREARKILTKEQKERYTIELYCIVANVPRHKRQFLLSAWMTYWVMDANARDHATAFVLTLSK